MINDSFTLENSCCLVHLTECPPSDDCVYSCVKEPPIDIFFHEDYADYEKQLLGKTFAYYTKDSTPNLVAAFTIANSALVLDFLQSSRKNKINKGIPRVKQRRQYPALLIAQLAVFDAFSMHRLGDELLFHIKEYAHALNESTACRYLIVEAVNKDKVIQFYERNGFQLLYSSEQDKQDKMKRKLSDDGNLSTRLMIYDLLLN